MKKHRDDRDSKSKHEVFDVPADVDVEKTVADEEETDVEKKGNHALNPLVRGIPFWIVPDEAEEPNEDDLPIDRELIEKIRLNSAVTREATCLVEL
ncbi:hypothetical protein KIN20_015543 [Parelaphostrongylus tenuis]|uniref:Uncharacterized protein n=1 Tax=Parelaphostrongylus tenuis TaxID=148309 RepID=A0AAD5MF40_PARTN|nr:hypothetical protein KIN20_015543 [Parelaphostrongylus tenuis]